MYSLRNLCNIAYWRRINKINQPASWSNKVNKQCQNTWERFEKNSDIKGNFPIIIGVKNAKTISLPKAFTNTEVRTKSNIPLRDICHIEVPSDKVGEVRYQLKITAPHIKVFPIELGELLEYRKNRR